MFILTQDNALAKITGIIRISHASYEEVYKISQVSRMGITALGEYSNEESANNVMLAIGAALENNIPLFKMPFESSKEDGSCLFSKDDLAKLKSHFRSSHSLL